MPHTRTCAHIPYVLDGYPHSSVTDSRVLPRRTVALTPPVHLFPLHSIISPTAPHVNTRRTVAHIQTCYLILSELDGYPHSSVTDLRVLPRQTVSFTKLVHLFPRL